NNLFADLGGGIWGNNGILFQLVGGLDGGTADVTIDHNTGFPTYLLVSAEEIHTGFVFTNNIAARGIYGFKGSGLAEGLSTLETDFPGYTFLKNVIPGANPAVYPPDNFFPATMNDVGFIDLAGGNYRLADSSPYKYAATDGTDIGCDIDALEAALGREPECAPCIQAAFHRSPPAGDFLAEDLLGA